MPSRDQRFHFVSEPITFLDALVTALVRAGQYNKNDQSPPAAILWPDRERQWDPLLPLGPYAPALRIGPAYWLRCVIARTLPDDVLPADAVPIIFLPGIGRASRRADGRLRPEAQPEGQRRAWPDPARQSDWRAQHGRCPA